MSQVFDLGPSEFRRAARAAGSRIQSAERRKESDSANHEPEQLTADFAHSTDVLNFLLVLVGCPTDLRGFLDAVIGLAGYRAAKREWFSASDKLLARRADRSTKWVQIKRNQLTTWQKKSNIALIDIEDNIYNDGQKVPHKYRVNVARFAVEAMLDARVSSNWQRGRFDEALEEAAKIMLDSLPDIPMHKKHKQSYRLDALSAMMSALKVALTKIRKAKRMNEETGNQLDVTPEMQDIIGSIRTTLVEIESVGTGSGRR